MDNFDIRYRVVYGEKGETEMKFVSWVWLGMTNQAQIGPQIGLLDLKSKNCQRSENENWDELLFFFFLVPASWESFFPQVTAESANG